MILRVPEIGRGGVLLIMAYTGRLTEWGSFFQLKVYKRKGVSQIEAHEMVGNLAFSYLVIFDVLS